MTEGNRPTGVIVTIEDIHKTVQEVRDTLNKISDIPKEIALLGERTRKLEIQNAAHWIVHSITVGAIVAAISRMLG